MKSFPGVGRAFLAMVLVGCAGPAVAGSAEVDPGPIVLASEWSLMETITVTATPVGDAPIIALARDRLARTPGAVAVVSAESLRDRFAIGFSDLLRDVPGVLVQKRYGEESRLSIRGSGISQPYHQRGVLIAQDGVPFADADGFSDFQKVDALGARYVEIYKGGNALRFGGAQLGGAINLVTPTGRNALADNILRIEGGSFDTLRARIGLARAWDQWDLYIAATGLTSDGYREWSDQEQVRATLNVGRRFAPDRELRLIVYGADIDQAVPGTLTLADALEKPRSAKPQVIEQAWARDQKIWRATLQTDWRLTDHLTFEGGVYATGSDIHHPISLVIDQKIETQGAFARFDWTGEIAGQRADLFWGASFRHGHNDQKLFVNANGARGYQFGDSRQKAHALDLFLEGRLFVMPQLAVVAGGSYGRAVRDYTNHLDAVHDSRVSHDWFAPRFGILWENGDGQQIYANLTRSVEPPHYGALVQSPLPGFVPVAPQRAWTAEAGTRGQGKAIVWDLALFRSEIRGELLSFNVFGLPSAFFNAGKTLHQGIEAGIDWMIADEIFGMDRLFLKQNYTFSDFRFRGDPVYGNNWLPVAPKHQYRVELKYDHAAGFFIAPALEWRISDVHVDYANYLKAPGFALLSLSAGWDMTEQASLFLDLRNLTDKRYSAEFGAITDARLPSIATDVFYPGEGRALFAGLTFKF